MPYCHHLVTIGPYNLTAVHPEGEVGIGWQDITPIERQIGFRFDTNLTGNPLTIGLHLFISLSEHCNQNNTRSEQFKEFLDVGHHKKSVDAGDCGRPTV